MMNIDSIQEFWEKNMSWRMITHNIVGIQN